MLTDGNHLSETIYDAKQIPGAIRKARKFRGLTVSNAAFLSQISRWQYQKIENGHVPKIETLEKICSALGLILTVFFGVKKSFSQKD